MDRVSAIRAQLERSGFGLAEISGSSMRPLIWGGHHCVAVAPAGQMPKLGDMLMFIQRIEGREIGIVHRLVEIKNVDNETVYITRGDNCIASETVRPRDVVGRVVEVHRVGGGRPWFAIASKKFAVTDLTYRLYVKVWTALWPLRRLFYRVRDRLSALLCRKLSKKMQR